MKRKQNQLNNFEIEDVEIPIHEHFLNPFEIKTKNLSTQ